MLELWEEDERVGDLDMNEEFDEVDEVVLEKGWLDMGKLRRKFDNFWVCVLLCLLG